MELNPPKVKLYFDTAAHPAHVTFDDGKNTQRNYPWHHYMEARWSYGEPDVIHVEIGEIVVVIMGHNIELLFTAIETQSLLRVKALPHLLKNPDRRNDSFATEIRFVKPPPKTQTPAAALHDSKSVPQGQFDFGG